MLYYKYHCIYVRAYVLAIYNFIFLNMFRLQKLEKWKQKAASALMIFNEQLICSVSIKNLGEAENYVLLGLLGS